MAMSVVSAPGRLAVPALRAVLAIVALVSQLVLGSLALPDRADARPLVTLQAAMVLCGNGPSSRTTPHHQRRHPNQETCCLLEAVLALPAVVLTPAVIMPLPRLPIAGRQAALPPARAPPAAPVRIPRARDPPSLA